LYVAVLAGEELTTGVVDISARVHVLPVALSISILMWLCALAAMLANIVKKKNFVLIIFYFLIIIICSFGVV
jgi:hypothetical protein